MAQLKTCNPAQAKRVWESMPNASTRRVARRLRQSGVGISHMTVARWRNQNWRPSLQEARHPLELARDHLDDAVPVLTGDPMTASTSFLREGADREPPEPLSDDEVLRRAAREVLRATNVIARVMMTEAMVAVTKPAEFGLLTQALAECVRAAAPVLSRQPEGPA
jgi:hypothetical protein